MDIGIFGLWGMNVPGRTFGGFETVYSEVAAHLISLGHRVTIYSRRECYPESLRVPQYRGVDIAYVPTWDTKSFSFLSATTTALWHAIFRKHHDVYLFANVGSGFHCFLTKFIGKRVVLNVDGLDWVRPKWNSIGQAYFKLAARAALFACDALLTDSDAMVAFYQREFGRTLDMISYGASIETSVDVGLLDKLQLKPGGYYLVVTRLIPDNNIHIIVEAFRKLETHRQLIVVGDANYDGDYQRRLRAIDDPRIRLVGRIHDQDLVRELYCNCYAYIHGHSVGGTNPALLRALGYGAAVLALNNVFNAEVLGQGQYGILWESPSDLEGTLRHIEDNPQLVVDLRSCGPDRIRQAYTWEQVTDRYVDLLNQIVGGRSDSSRRMKRVKIGLATTLLLSAVTIWLLLGMRLG